MLVNIITTLLWASRTGGAAVFGWLTLHQTLTHMCVQEHSVMKLLYKSYHHPRSRTHTATLITYILWNWQTRQEAASAAFPSGNDDHWCFPGLP